ncbi:unnamed protein product [Brachionus calyciflorus]|uniref:Coiled-coil domain-containing protein 103 n=1 Tax=Brachionus calyciflorus TaxID=104777 RepID=A0A814EMS5_9BILA|nr:unnamed protein product [Brachionus calyciflorus]
MIESDKFEINIQKLKNQVEREVLAEQKYQRENDAKLRAIEQRVPTYEDFRQMVMASHLKPLDKGESLRDNIQKGAKVWNSIADNKLVDMNGLNLNENVNMKTNLVNSVPKNNLEFLKTWRQIENLELEEKDDAKWEFLKNLGIEKLFNIFQSEINGDLLGKFLVLFEHKLKTEFTETSNFVIELLSIFPKCNRFKLNLMFLKAEELSACKNIFELFDVNSLSVGDLKKVYL